jgi:hypothetical protein
MARTGLTVFTLKAAKAEAKRTGARVAKRDGRGLFYCALPSGGESWTQYARVEGKLVKFTLKDAATSIPAARRWGSEIRDKVARGADPRDEQKTAKAKAEELAARTVRSVAEQYLQREEKAGRLRTIGQRRDTFERLIFPRIGSKPIADVRRRDIVELMDFIEDTRGQRMADEVLACYRLLERWYALRDDEHRCVVVTGMTRANKTERARSRILSDDELRKVSSAADRMPVFGALLQFILATATRRKEAAHMRHSEVTGTDWLIPGTRYKNKHDHLIPLSAMARTVIEKVPRIGDADFVFSLDGVHPVGDFANKKKRFDALCGVSGWVLHDLRRTSRSLLARAGISDDVAERCLGHLAPSLVRRYNKHRYRDELAAAFEKLAELIEQIVNPQDNVVALRR